MITREIERRLAKLDALEAGGVDNWDGYDNSLEQWFKDNERENIVDEFIRFVEEVLLVDHAEASYPSDVAAGMNITLTGQGHDAIRSELHKLIGEVLRGEQ